MEVSPQWTPSPLLAVSGLVQWNTIEFPTRDQALNALVTRVRIQSALRRGLTASAFIQYSDVAGVFSGNVRLRYNFGEGRDMYVVWDQLDAREPTLGIDQGHRLMVKVVHAFGW
jgi:hypothetical protein